MRLVEKLKAAATNSGLQQDAPAVDLFRGVVYDTRHDKFVSVLNRVRWILDDTEEATASFRDIDILEADDPMQEITELVVWRLGVDGTLTRWNAHEDVEELPGGGRRLRASVTDIESGVVVGESRVMRAPAFPTESGVRMAPQYPVVLFQFDSERDDDERLEVVVRNVPVDAYKQKTLKEHRGWPTHTRVVARDVWPAPRGPYQIPVHAAAPAVAMHPTSIRLPDGGWEHLRHWNQVAFSFSSWAEPMLEADGSVEELAKRIAAGTATVRESADELYRWVRDNLDRPDRRLYQGGDRRSAGQVLRSGWGTSLERDCLLIALLRTLHVRASFGHIRPPYMGEPTSETPLLSDYPLPAVVAHLPGRSAIYVLDYNGMHPGEIGLDLDGGMLVRLEVVDDRVKEQFYAEMMRLSGPDKFDAHMKSQPWSRRYRLQATNTDPVRVRTRLEASAEKPDARLEIRASGPGDVLNVLWDEVADSSTVADLREALGIPDQMVIEGESEILPVDDRDRVRAIALHVSLPEYDPAGRAPLLVPEVLLGSSRITGWEDVPHGSFYVDAPEIYAAEARVPLPPGTDLVPAPGALRNERFEWQVQVEIQEHGEDRWLQIRRVIRTRRGESRGSELEHIREHLRWIREFEGRSLTREAGAGME